MTARSRGRRRRHRRRSPRCCWPPPSSCRRRASAPTRSADADDDSLYLRRATALRRLAGAYSALAADVYWIRAIQYYGGTKQRLDAIRRRRRAAAARRRSPADDYPLLYPLLDLTTTLDPRFNIAYRFGAVFLAEAVSRAAPAGPIWRSRCSRRDCATRPDKWEYMEDIGFVHYWYRHDYHAAADWFEKASDVPGAPVVAALAGGDDARAGRRSAVVARDVGGDSAVGGNRLAAQGRRAPAAAAARARRDRRAAARCRRLRAPHGRSRPTGRRSSARGVLRGIPLDPDRHAVRADADGRVQLSQVVAALAAAGRAGALAARRPHDRDAAAAVRLVAAGAFGARRRQLPERLHLPAAARRVDRLAGVGVPALRARAVVVREHSGRQLPACCAARCRTCRAPISFRYPIVEALTAAMFAAAWWYYGPGPLLASRLVFGCALIVLFAIDLEHHLLPNAITLPGHRRRLRLQLLHRARVGWRRSSGCWSAAASCI